MQKALSERDAQIAELMARISSHEQESREERVRTNVEGQSSGPPISPQDIKNLVAQGIREFQLSQNPPVLGYRKPYPVHYDAVPFPAGYQRPIFDKFDGLHGSPHEHLAHFYSACGETTLNYALLIRQFVQSLKGSAFTWYTQLQPGSIQTWDDLQRAFLSQFVSSKAKVSIMDLENSLQRPNEPANDFIARWRSLRLQCSEKIS